MKQERLLKARLGYLPQSFGLFDELTVWQFLDYMAALKGIDNSQEAIAAAIQSTNLEEKQKAKIRTLSGGQRPRVGIALFHKIRKFLRHGAADDTLGRVDAGGNMQAHLLPPVFLPKSFSHF